MTSPVRPSTTYVQPNVAGIGRWLRHPVETAVVLWVRRVTQGRVASGTFRGMRWPYSGGWLPYLLGTHEMELAPALADLVAHPFASVVNVGAATGYYAVGFAVRMPQTRVVVFESDAFSSAQCLNVARLNGVDARMEPLGFCTPDALQRALDSHPDSLVVTDIEGGEIDLLDPGAVPSLRGATVLVETHDFLRPRCSATLRERFEATHDIEVIRSRARTLDDFRAAVGGPMPAVAPGACLRLIDEKRGAVQEWLVLRPRRTAM